MSRVSSSRANGSRASGPRANAALVKEEKEEEADEDQTMTMTSKLEETGAGACAEAQDRAEAGRHGDGAFARRMLRMLHERCVRCGVAQATPGCAQLECTGCCRPRCALHKSVHKDLTGWVDRMHVRRKGRREPRRWTPNYMADRHPERLLVKVGDSAVIFCMSDYVSTVAFSKRTKVSASKASATNSKSRAFALEKILRRSKPSRRRDHTTTWLERLYATPEHADVESGAPATA